MTEVASKPVEWFCLGPLQEGEPPNETLTIFPDGRYQRQFICGAQTWFEARSKAARRFGCEPGQVSARRYDD